MSGHFPFSGNATRVDTFAFFERYGLNETLQEKYYKWWYNWAKKKVLADADLNVTKGTEFAHYPYGLHARHDFHLHQSAWATSLADLGAFIKGNLLPKLDENQCHLLDASHRRLLHELELEARKSPRPAAPELGWFRHF